MVKKSRGREGRDVCCRATRETSHIPVKSTQICNNKTKKKGGDGHTQWNARSSSSLDQSVKLNKPHHTKKSALTTTGKD